MPQIEFSLQLSEHVDCPVQGEFPVGTIRTGLAQWFQQYPKLSEYLLDSDGNLRGHLSIFIDGVMVRSSDALDQEVGGSSEVFVMQAISGG
ncbi:MAG: MoaD/ThiS family protein [Rubripirellula sp.]